MSKLEACTKTRNNRNETTWTTGTKQPERNNLNNRNETTGTKQPERNNRNETTGTTGTRIGKDRNHRNQNRTRSFRSCSTTLFRSCSILVSVVPVISDSCSGRSGCFVPVVSGFSTCRCEHTNKRTNKRTKSHAEYNAVTNLGTAISVNK
jgi:hypothetical protein